MHPLDDAFVNTTNRSLYMRGCVEGSQTLEGYQTMNLLICLGPLSTLYSLVLDEIQHGLRARSPSCISLLKPILREISH